MNGWPSCLIASLAGLLGLSFCLPVSAANFSNFNDYAGVGLMQTPAARVADEGEFGVGIQVGDPYRQLQFSMQIFSRMEAAFHYTEVDNRLYGPESFSGHQSYKDRSFDLKFLLSKEGRLWPALAIGTMDLGGTGLFSSEYLVANKRLADFDFSMGLGWGRLGSRGGIRNPFRWASSHFDDRPETSDPGKSGFSRLFTGSDIGVFGGVRWQTPIRSLSVMAELDGNNFKHEALDNDQKVDSPINIGLSWRPNPFVDTSVSFERGNTVAARLTLRTNFVRDVGSPKFLDPPVPRAAQPEAVPQPAPAPEPRSAAPPVADTTWRPTDAGCAAEDQDFELLLRKAMADQGLGLQGLRCDTDGTTLSVWFTQTRYRSEADALGRLERVLAGLAPKRFTVFRVSEIYLGFEAYRLSLPREIAEQLLTGKTWREGVQAEIRLDPPKLNAEWDDCCNVARYPASSWYTSPALRQHVGGADQFYFYQLWWKLGGALALNPRWNLSGQVGANIYNNFDDLHQPSDSVLPHVRSDIVKYLKQGKNNIVRLESNYFFPVAGSLYGRVSGGLFEEMYGGVAGELLYRPFQSPWAIGARAAHLWQRDYDQRFDFLDYNVTTGYLTGYYEYRPEHLSFVLSYGRYLAKDWGATLNVGKVFANGVTVGAFATKTNVSSEDFGEGSFDKGVYIVIPLDFFFAKSTRRVFPLVFRPLTRDGGQMARDGVLLYGATTTLPEFSAGDPYLVH
jgi:hypothetical protein